MEVNSKEYWDFRFDNNWESCGGKEQTEGFMNILINNLPEDVKIYMSDNASILDWGCAEGQGVGVLSRKFLKSSVCGLDVSDVAIEKCRNLYPNHKFQNGYLGEGDYFDVIVTSNCLEHFSNPFYWVEKAMEHTGKYYILLVPFNQYIPEDEDFEHKFSFTGDSFPSEVGSFVKHYEAVVNNCNPYWGGQQILVIYKRN